MPPILDNKNPKSQSVFLPSALLREARRQKGLATADVPPVCILDPDGDILRRIISTGKARRLETWPCYHTDLYTFSLAGETVGLVGCVVGAPFAVLIAEELFACGCRHLLSVTSAGQIVPARTPPYFVVIDRALRDEGTSYHYAAPSEFADADTHLISTVAKALSDADISALVGPSWTTDAPFRETVEAIETARTKGITFALSRNASVLCIAHVTNTMGQVQQDFEKGELDGTTEALRVLEVAMKAVLVQERP